MNNPRSKPHGTSLSVSHFPVKFPRAFPGNSRITLHLYKEIAMTTIDRGILEFCAKDFRRLKELRAIFPGGTLYRHAKRLIKIGWLERQGPLYRSTSTGLRNLSDDQEGRWDRLDQMYAPLGLIPTEEHRGLVELILAA